MTTTVPLFHCKSLETSLDFYRAAGFTVTYEQREPYPYASVQQEVGGQGTTELHLANLRVYGAKEGMGAMLVFVPEVAPLHRAMVDGLRARYGRVPVMGLPRITRLRPGHTRFKLFDPAGNMLIYINTNEPDADYSYDATLSRLAQALDNANFLRDTYANDKAAARVLDVALQRAATVDLNAGGMAALDRARVLAGRAELAVAMGERALAELLRQELQRIKLSAADRARYEEELGAAERLERWLVEPL